MPDRPAVRATVRRRAAVVRALVFLGALSLVACSDDGPGNSKPVIEATATPAAAVLRPFSQSIRATDPDGDPVSYALTVAPSGMTIDANTGVVQWTPQPAQAGAQQFTVLASDGRGGEARQVFTVTVAPNTAPTVAAAAPASAVAFEPLALPVSGADPDGDALLYSLSDAPPGMTIDPATGAIAWTPRLVSLGSVRYTVMVDDRRGGTATREFTAKVSAPEGFPAFIRLELASPGHALGQPVRVAWTLGGSVPEDAVVELRVRAPVIVPTGDGSPAQVEWSLGSNGQWSVERVDTQSPAADGERAFALPSAAVGAWRIEAMLADADGKPLDVTVRTFLVGDAPALHLELSRSIANSFDRVQARLIESAGATPKPVRVVAWLVKPGGAEVGLPGSNPRSIELRRGDSTNAMTTLLNRVFLEGETGEYRVHARLYDHADGRLLHETSAGFSVCDGGATATGLVRAPDGRPLNGTQGAFASVRALDLDDGATTASSVVAVDGAYSMNVEPGRYRLIASHVGEDHILRSAVSDETIVGCGSGAVTTNLTLGATP